MKRSIRIIALLIVCFAASSVAAQDSARTSSSSEPDAALPSSIDVGRVTLALPITLESVRGSADLKDGERAVVMFDVVGADETTLTVRCHSGNPGRASGCVAHAKGNPPQELVVDEAANVAAAIQQWHDVHAGSARTRRVRSTDRLRGDETADQLVMWIKELLRGL